jgi:hypothetical protein
MASSYEIFIATMLYSALLLPASLVRTSIGFGFLLTPKAILASAREVENPSVQGKIEPTRYSHCRAAKLWRITRRVELTRMEPHPVPRGCPKTCSLNKLSVYQDIVAPVYASRGFSLGVPLPLGLALLGGVDLSEGLRRLLAGL